MLQQKSLKFVKYAVIFFLITLVILLLSFVGFIKPVEGFFGKITSPVISIFSGMSSGLKDFGKSINDLGNLQKENKDLKSQVKELTLEVGNLKELKIENESLKKQLGFMESVPHKTLGASVLAKEPSNFLKIIIINRGEKDGVRKNMAVLSDGFLVGKVHEVTSNTAKVILLMDSNFQISGLTQENRTLGLIRGQVGSGLVMEEIPKDKIIKVGDTVISSNLETEIPEGLLIGKVTEVGQESGGLFQKASISSFSNLDEIRNVVLILGLK